MICKLMIADFMFKGIDPAIEGQNYDRYNILKGLSYSNWLIEQGYKKEPHFGFSLFKFNKWLKRKYKRLKN